MVYRALGLMSGSSLDGLDMAWVEFTEQRGQWTFDLKLGYTHPYSADWQLALKNAPQLNAQQYCLLDIAFGRMMAEAVNQLVELHQLHHQIQLIGSHGHTTFHLPEQGLTQQIGDGATVAALTGINVVSNLRALDVALGGQGAPIVPIGESKLWPNHQLFLNLGGIANLQAHLSTGIIAFDVCPANRVLNALVGPLGLAYDDGGQVAASGFLRDEVLSNLNQQPYYNLAWPKSLANEFGEETLLPILKNANLSVADASRTYVEHLVIQITRNIGRILPKLNKPYQLFVTGGGAHHQFLIQRLQSALKPMGVALVVPPRDIIDYKESIVMALLAVLRWREETTTQPLATGATRPSSGGALWLGQTP